MSRERPIAPSLADRWTQAWRQATSSDAQVELEILEKAYSEKHRAYHNLEHIADCLHQLDTCNVQPADRLAVEIAFWFHDVVYKTRSQTNEADSAAWASHSLQKGHASTELIERVESQILATEHNDAPQDPDACLVVDIDLSILGRAPDDFASYEDKIRREYRWVPGPLYRRKRAQVLESFLQRTEIYQNVDFRNRFESQARANLESSLRTLR